MQLKRISLFKVVSNQVRVFFPDVANRGEIHSPDEHQSERPQTVRKEASGGQP